MIWPGAGKLLATCATIAICVAVTPPIAEGVAGSVAHRRSFSLSHREVRAEWATSRERVGVRGSRGRFLNSRRVALNSPSPQPSPVGRVGKTSRSIDPPEMNLEARSSADASAAGNPPSAGGVLTTRPAVLATQPAGPSAAPPQKLPAEFELFNTRNPFAHGKGGPGGPNAPGGPEAMFVLRGVAQTGTQYTAFIEDTAAKRVMELAAGSPVATGRIKSVDIDTIEFEMSGHSRRIAVGQNLAGQVVPPTPAPKPAGPPAPPGGAPGQGPGPQPGQPGGPMPPGAKPRPGKGAPPGESSSSPSPSGTGPG
jgi:hypothetical protein